jgi:hypothetical protein
MEFAGQAKSFESDRDDIFLNCPEPSPLLSVDSTVLADEAVKPSAEKGHPHLASGHPLQRPKYSIS